MGINAEDVLNYYMMVDKKGYRANYEFRRLHALVRKIKDERFKHEYKNRLDGVIHKNAEGTEVDVSNIDKRYAVNLYNWYQKNINLVGREYFENSVMIQTLKNIIG